MMPYRDRIQLPLMVGLVAALLVWWHGADAFGYEVLAEILIFAIFAMSLDLLVGYAGMVSLGHAVFMAVGAYSTAALTTFLNWSPGAATFVAIAVAALFALAVGLFAVRLGGVFFIMITLAIGQMGYAYLFKARAFGADDGMSGTPRMELSALGLDADNPATFAALMLVAMVLIYALLRMLMHSHFGAMLVGIRQNENRLRALGLPVLRYKLAVFTIAGAVAGFAGALIAQYTGFVSPDLAFWTVSGEVLIMVIIGGMGSLIGAVVGAIVLIQLRYTLSDSGFWESIGLSTNIAEFWQLMLGLLFIVVVLVAGDGLYGRLGALWSWCARRR